MFKLLVLFMTIVQVMHYFLSMYLFVLQKKQLHDFFCKLLIK